MRKILLLICINIAALTVFSQKTYIWCGVLIDGISNEPKKEMTIIIEKNKIVAVEKGYSKAGAADKTIDLKTKTVTPGWMDMHVHME
ncbi:MAG TPA: amidohydrolase family protein, partial [Chitinophagaceae bacterium]